MKTLLIDYGAGNLHSVHKALLTTGFDVSISANPQDAYNTEIMILPGQGHFRQVMESFLASGFEPVVRQHIQNQKPFLGICIGLQLLMESSEEAPGVKGLGIIPGQVKRFPSHKVSVPQMGWNQIYKHGNPALLADIPDGAFVYYLNSYYVDFSDTSLPGAITTYGDITFKSAVSSGPLNATQFHPEKSQSIGLKILENFRQLAQRYIRKQL